MFVIVGDVTFLGSDDETTNLYLKDPTIQEEIRIRQIVYYKHNKVICSPVVNGRKMCYISFCFVHI